MKTIVISIILLCCFQAHADYLIASRSGNIKELPDSHSLTVLHIEEDQVLILLQNGTQTNGYYNVQLPDGSVTGWFYKTLVRRYTGDPPGVVVPAPASTVSTPSGTPASQQDQMVAHFINVGQGDATLLEFPCGVVLIDAGAQDSIFEQKLVDYLNEFFDAKPQFNRTIDLVLVTHAHKDHNLALDEVVSNFTVKRYIDNGMRTGSGKANQNWLEDNAASLDIEYGSYTFEQITTGGNKKGLSNALIDPLNCGGVDPKITLYSGRFGNKPTGWSQTDFNNGNNQSLVIKVVYGNSSFLFTGDLEEDGILTVTDFYEGTDVLDVDILHIGHHGADNATTAEFLGAITPTHAIISCGPWNYGLGPNDDKMFNTYNYGHPRISCIDRLVASTVENRDHSITTKAAEGAKDFTNITVSKKIYATPWDRTIRLTASKDRKYTVQTSN